MPKGSLCPPHAGPGWAGDGGQEDGYGDIPPGTWGGNNIGQSPQSTEQQDRHHRVTRSRECSTGQVLSFPPGLAARG